MARSGTSIDTEQLAKRYREQVIDLRGRRVLISRLSGSRQELDIKRPVNCDGYGRIRHFCLGTSLGWPCNPLPIVPACKALGIESVPDEMCAQVFQNAACAWRCWYCYVPYKLLSADPESTEWFTSEELVKLYAQEDDRPCIIVLSGGSPDLVPEWTLWMMDALVAAGLHKSTYLWSDDNLSTAYLFDDMSSVHRDRLVRYRNYGRVCCFKGYDARSFEFNTRAAPDAYEQQFEIMNRLLGLGLDIYGYVTLTSPHADRVVKSVCEFVDRLQELDPNLPLRVVPLKIDTNFRSVRLRPNLPCHEHSLEVQEEAIAAWNSEIEDRFELGLRTADICDIPLGLGRT